MNQLSKCCHSYIVREGDWPICAACDEIQYAEPTPPTSTEVEEILKAHAAWWSDSMNQWPVHLSSKQANQAITRLLQQAELRGEQRVCEKMKLTKPYSENHSFKLMVDRHLLQLQAQLDQLEK